MNTENNKYKRPFLSKGIVITIIVIVAILCLAIGSITTWGTMTIIKRLPELLNRNATGEQEITEEVQPEIEKPEEELPDVSEEKPEGIITLEEYNRAVSEVVEELTPSVVNIRVTVEAQDIFGRIQEGEGIGSGVIYTDDGYIITNYHVAGEAKEILVTMSDGTEYPAELTGGHKDTDIAVIKVDSDNLKAAEFASIDNVVVGEMAIAVGSPFGLTQTITVGVVSAKNRDIAIYSDTLPMVNLIQTDAAINQGNSGGPLINSSGQVIGINSIIFSPSGASAGIGFAIPSDTVVNIAKQIIEYGEARIPYMGIEMGDNTTEIKGVYIVDVTDGYPAEESGLEPGDIITEIDGTEIQTPYDLLAQILKRNVGDIMSLTVYRDGELIKIEVQLTESPSG